MACWTPFSNTREYERQHRGAQAHERLHGAVLPAVGLEQTHHVGHAGRSERAHAAPPELEYNKMLQKSTFQKIVMEHWRRDGRHDLPWRTNINPYRILVSEMMLQQTQVSRVTGKFRSFIRAFPTFRALALAKPSAVIREWQGLGYNRRALMLHRCACEVTLLHAGRLPRDPDALCRLPGIGPYTAGAILVFAYDEPWPLLETNIRRSYLHHFFPGRRSVADRELLPVIERTMDRSHPRRWFSALMDYGAWLAGQVPNPNRRSRHYVKQSAFEGSDRQLRGRILRAMLQNEPLPADRRTGRIVARLIEEGFVVS